ncbi:MAG TPA: hypothetical protein VNA88_12340 [Candidatus Kapabacteria bacterium]|nr:hypothetical protein [Candidatus Kapabacteria bacterium]
MIVVAFIVVFVVAIVVARMVAIEVGDRRLVRSHSMRVVECDRDHFASIVARGRRATSRALVETLARSLVGDARARGRESAMRCNPHEHWAAATRARRAERAAHASHALAARHRCLWKPVFMPCCGSRPRKKKCTCTRNTCIM